MTGQQCTKNLAELLAPYARACEADIERWLIEPGTPGPLAEAMRYCALGAGKRLRPALVRMSAETVGDGRGALTARAAVSVELVHAYSLVHDDLPAMDDDRLRRGRPTAHVKFGEAMAILTGDALLTRAFGVLGESDDRRAGRVVAELARWAGAVGMVAGQVADMDLCPLPPGRQRVRYIHLSKTAALLRASARMGAISAGADEDQLRALDAYAESLGLAFQAIDDVLDVTGRAATTGKTPGKDAEAGKRTGVTALGVEGARASAAQLTGKAIGALEPFGPRAGVLRRLAELLTQRTH